MMESTEIEIVTPEREFLSSSPSHASPKEQDFEILHLNKKLMELEKKRKIENESAAQGISSAKKMLLMKESAFQREKSKVALYEQQISAMEIKLEELKNENRALSVKLGIAEAENREKERIISEVRKQKEDEAAKRNEEKKMHNESLRFAEEKLQHLKNEKDEEFNKLQKEILEKNEEIKQIHKENIDLLKRWDDFFKRQEESSIQSVESKVTIAISEMRKQFEDEKDRMIKQFEEDKEQMEKDFETVLEKKENEKENAISCLRDDIRILKDNLEKEKRSSKEKIELERARAQKEKQDLEMSVKREEDRKRDAVDARVREEVSRESQKTREAEKLLKEARNELKRLELAAKGIRQKAREEKEKEVSEVADSMTEEFQKKEQSWKLLLEEEKAANEERHKSLVDEVVQLRQLAYEKEREKEEEKRKISIALEEESKAREEEFKRAAAKERSRWEQEIERVTKEEQQNTKELAERCIRLEKEKARLTAEAKTREELRESRLKEAEQERDELLASRAEFEGQMVRRMESALKETEEGYKAEMTRREKHWEGELLKQEREKKKAIDNLLDERVGIEIALKQASEEEKRQRECAMQLKTQLEQLKGQCGVWKEDAKSEMAAQKASFERKEEALKRMHEEEVKRLSVNAVNLQKEIAQMKNHHSTEIEAKEEIIRQCRKQLEFERQHYQKHVDQLKESAVVEQRLRDESIIDLKIAMAAEAKENEDLLSTLTEEREKLKAKERELGKHLMILSQERGRETEEHEATRHSYAVRVRDLERDLKDKETEISIEKEKKAELERWRKEEEIEKSMLMNTMKSTSMILPTNSPKVFQQGMTQAAPDHSFDSSAQLETPQGYSTHSSMALSNSQPHSNVQVPSTVPSTALPPLPTLGLPDALPSFNHTVPLSASLPALSLSSSVSTSSPHFTSSMNDTSHFTNTAYAQPTSFSASPDLSQSFRSSPEYLLSSTAPTYPSSNTHFPLSFQSNPSADSNSPSNLLANSFNSSLRAPLEMPTENAYGIVSGSDTRQVSMQMKESPMLFAGDSSEQQSSPFRMKSDLNDYSHLDEQMQISRVTPPSSMRQAFALSPPINPPRPVSFSSPFSELRTTSAPVSRPSLVFSHSQNELELSSNMPQEFRSPDSPQPPPPTPTSGRSQIYSQNVLSLPIGDDDGKTLLKQPDNKDSEYMREISDSAIRHPASYTPLFPHSAKLIQKNDEAQRNETNGSALQHQKSFAPNESVLHPNETTLLISESEFDVSKQKPISAQSNSIITKKKKRKISKKNN
ncbi:uncharacterized protein MONOS_7489 [Monocercomonoides exilis]|uniref:uncharacterized protein n=1 Tax=Monocercomonoides exilis TaxID=2049356 RepID=UPI003559C60C|nr:hypothetical protein MONOS_7489 [Monocercomonoides exilis]